MPRSAAANAEWMYSDYEFSHVLKYGLYDTRWQPMSSSNKFSENARLVVKHSPSLKFNSFRFCWFQFECQFYYYIITLYNFAHKLIQPLIWFHFAFAQHTSINVPTQRFVCPWRQWWWWWWWCKFSAKISILVFCKHCKCLRSMAHRLSFR